MSGMVTVSTSVEHETDSAILLGEYGVWLPKSQIEYDGGCDILVPKWLADQEGLDY